jgi:hypothetical protein
MNIKSCCERSTRDNLYYIDKRRMPNVQKRGSGECKKINARLSTYQWRGFRKDSLKTVTAHEAALATMAVK